MSFSHRKNIMGRKVQYLAENLYNPPRILTELLQLQSPVRSPYSGVSCDDSCAPRGQSLSLLLCVLHVAWMVVDTLSCSVSSPNVCTLIILCWWQWIHLNKERKLLLPWFQRLSGLLQSPLRADIVGVLLQWMPPRTHLKTNQSLTPAVARNLGCCGFQLCPSFGWKELPCPRYTDQAWKHVSQKSQSQKTTYTITFIWKSRTRKPIEKESGLVVT